MRIKSAYIEITNLCNLNCSTCYNRSGLNKTKREFSFQDLSQTLRRLRSEFGCQTFRFSGGEPFLHSEMPALIAHMSTLLEEDSEINFGFVTNGTISQPELIQLMQQYPERFLLQISLDGSCEEINARTRGVGSFGKSISFLDEVVKSGVKPIVKMVISRHNIADLESFFHMAIQHGASPEFAFVNPAGNALDGWETKGLSAKEKLQALRKINQLGKHYGLEPSLPRTSLGCALADSEAPLGVLIKCNGVMQPCQLLYDEAYSLGNILTDSTELIHEKRALLSHLACERERRDYGCKNCILKTGCHKGCPAYAVYATGDFLSADGDCDARRLEMLTFDFHL